MGLTRGVEKVLCEGKCHRIMEAERIKVTLECRLLKQREIIDLRKGVRY